MPEIEVPVAGVHSRAGRQRKRKEPEVVDERTARLQKRMVCLSSQQPCADYASFWTYTCYPHGSFSEIFDDICMRCADTKIKEK